MAGKKDRRIAELEAEVTRLAGALATERQKVTARDQQIKRLSQRPPSLVEQAKRRWNGWCDDMMRAVGL